MFRSRLCGFMYRWSMLVAFALSSLAVVKPLQAQTGSISGKVTDEHGTAVAGAEVSLDQAGKTGLTAATGEYTLEGVAPGSHTVRVRVIGYRSQTVTVSVTAGAKATQDFSLAADPLHLEAVVVTGTETPRTKLETTNATTVLSKADITMAAPRSTSEILRFVPGFTRVESSGGEVNENYTMRGILGVEYVMFMEDGLPVYPTMHTFFMNADNLFRLDENVDHVEVVRGGGSALYGSNTPGAIMNVINKTGGSQNSGSMVATAATEGLVRYDLNLNGPLSDNWRYNVGGFYRYDHGVRDPGFPGIRGGQFKASLTHLLPNGYVRGSVKLMDDHNQFILDLPFQNPDNPQPVSGFSDYGSMNTNEGNHIQVPTPTGNLVLPLDDGLGTKGYWLTGDASFSFSNGWTLRNSGQLMSDQQSWNAIVPFDVMPESSYISSLGLVADSVKVLYTNIFADTIHKAAFSTANGLVAPGGEWHVAKPLTAFQDQLLLSRQLGQNTISAGLYFANYTQENHWYFTDILTDVADNPHFLDVLAFAAANTTFVTKNGFRHFVSLYVNGSGQTTVLSGSLAGSFKLSDRLRTDLGFRVEGNDFVQSVENTSNIDLDKSALTTYDVENWGNGTFRHFNRTISDWAGSVGVNYALSDQTSLYFQGARGYKMPALDEFLNYQQQAQVDSVKPKRVYTGEVGVKHAGRSFGVTLTAFYTELRNISTQGALLNGSGQLVWYIQNVPSNRAYGLEAEASGRLANGLGAITNWTLMKADYSNCPTQTQTQQGCPTGADVGTLLNGIPPLIGNLAVTYIGRAGLGLDVDWHFVDKRYATYTDTAGHRNFLPTYSYLNLGGMYTITPGNVTLRVDLMNVTQSKGLEEGNPRLSLVGGRTSNLFLARPILPRRFQLSMGYRF